MFFRVLALVCALAITQVAADDGVTEFNGFKVFHNVINTSMLQPAVAKQYGIQRAPNRAYVNISLRTSDDSLLGEPLKAKVTGEVKNALGQVRYLEFEQISEKDAIYYIAVLRFRDKERLQFNISVAPYSDFITRKVSFSRQLHEQ